MASIPPRGVFSADALPGSLGAGSPPQASRSRTDVDQVARSAIHNSSASVYDSGGSSAHITQEHKSPDQIRQSEEKLFSDSLQKILEICTPGFSDAKRLHMEYTIFKKYNSCSPFEIAARAIKASFNVDIDPSIPTSQLDMLCEQMLQIALSKGPSPIQNVEPNQQVRVLGMLRTTIETILVRLPDPAVLSLEKRLMRYVEIRKEFEPMKKNVFEEMSRVAETVSEYSQAAPAQMGVSKTRQLLTDAVCAPFDLIVDDLEEQIYSIILLYRKELCKTASQEVANYEFSSVVVSDNACDAEVLRPNGTVFSFRFYVVRVDAKYLESFFIKGYQPKPKSGEGFEGCFQEGRPKAPWCNCMAFAVNRHGLARGLSPDGSGNVSCDFKQFQQDLVKSGCVNLAGYEGERWEFGSYLVAFVLSPDDFHVYRCCKHPVIKDAVIWVDLLKETGIHYVTDNQGNLLQGIPDNPRAHFCSEAYPLFAGYWLVPFQAEFFEMWGGVEAKAPTKTPAVPVVKNEIKDLS